MKVFSSLKNRLTLNYFIVATLPILVAGLIASESPRAGMERQIKEKNFLLAKSLAGELEQFLNEPRNLLAHARDMAEQSDLIVYDKLNDYLNRLIVNVGAFDMILILNHKGRVIHHAPFDPNIDGLDMSFQDFYRIPKETKAPYWSKIFFAPQTGRPTLTLTLPFSGGMVVGHLDLSGIGKITDRVKIDAHGYAAVSDSDGVTLAHPNKKFVQQRLNVGHLPAARQGMAGNEGVYKYIFKGKEKIGSVAIVPQTGWLVLFTQPTDEAFSPVEKIRTIILVGSLASVLLAAAIALVSLKKALQPLFRFSEEARRIAGGDYTFEPRFTSYMEIDNLACSFKTMTDAIRVREKALRESEEKHRGLIESSRDWIWEVDANGIHTYASPMVEEMLGYKPREVVGMTPFELMPPEEATRIAGFFEAAAAKRESIVALENVNMHKDGRRVVLEKNGVPVLDAAGRVAGFRGVDRDITKRKEREAELRRLRNYLSNIIDSMPSALVGVDMKGKVTQWNKTAEQSTGIVADDALGKPLPDVFPDAALEMSSIVESIRKREIMQEHKRPRSSGAGARYEDVTIYPLTTNGVEGAVIRIDDVTDKVRMEEMMIQSEKMLSVGGLAAGMAHEINNPLAGMMQTANVLTSRLTVENIPANERAAAKAGVTMDAIRAFMKARGVPRMVAAINQSGRRVADIVTNMLSFARKCDDRASTHGLAELLDKTLELAATDYDLKKRYDFRRIEIRKEYEDNLPPTPCEGAKIQQVLLNILRNGAHAMQEAAEENKREGRRCENPCFILRLSREPEIDRVYIEIEDNGPGMDEATRRRIFEPFFTTKPVGVGTGLGLSVSYFIITENHGGEMSVASTPGEGSTFRITLPVKGRDV